jgi:Zn-dependent protease
MDTPTFLSPTDPVIHLGKVFDTPLVAKGWTWLPVNELALWIILSVRARRKHPDWSTPTQWLSGFLNMAVMLGSEWGHNLGHAAMARWMGKPMDALRVTWGMPLVIYYQPEEPSITPHQHILRSLGGPLLNLALLPLALLAKLFTRADTVARDAADAAVAMNTFLSTASLLPIPGIDGGPILKWSLVSQGKTPQEASAVVKKVNIYTAAGLGVVAGVTLKKKNWVLGGILALLGTIALAISLGWLKEK